MNEVPWLSSPSPMGTIDSMLGTMRWVDLDAPIVNENLKLTPPPPPPKKKKTHTYHVEWITKLFEMSLFLALFKNIKGFKR
jgi:hypothetical protein